MSAGVGGTEATALKMPTKWSTIITLTMARWTMRGNRTTIAAKAATAESTATKSWAESQTGSAQEPSAPDKAASPRINAERGRMDTAAPVTTRPGRTSGNAWLPNAMSQRQAA